MAMAMAMPKHTGGNGSWRELRHKSAFCCFGWALYVPWACYMNLRTLHVHVSKLAKYPRICLADLAGDLGEWAACMSNARNAQCAVVCLFYIAGCRLQVAGCRLQVADCRLQVAGCRVRVGCPTQQRREKDRN